jgi:hypothetical protein
MAVFGPMEFITAAVQVIPVLAVVIVADDFIRRDIADPVHRIWPSHTPAIGLLFGVAGEVAGLRALLTGPTRQTIPMVSAGLMALGGAALGPRLVELFLPMYPDVARRVTQRLMPAIIGTVGLVAFTSQVPLGYRVALYVFVALYMLLVVINLVLNPPKSHTARHSTQTAESQGHPQVRGISARTPPSEGARQMNRWCAVACVASIVVAIGVRRRRRHLRPS